MASRLPLEHTCHKMDTEYQRPPLEDPIRQIRLLHLFPGTGDVWCSLSVHDQRDVAGKYVAISYTWGEPNPTRTIHFKSASDASSQGTCTVRFNCWYALRQMRMHNVHQLYWIDSICIDQDCHGEKMDQVSQMGTIYANAAMVAACIGRSGPDQLLMDKAQQLKSTSEEDRRLAIRSLSERSYFQRLWVVQECLLAADVTLFCGRARQTIKQLSWKLNAQVALLKMEDDGDIGGLVRFFADYNAMAHMENNTQSEITTYFDLAAVVFKVCHRNCFDPRDKIFGVLSLTSPDTQHMFPVDYKNSLLTVLLTFVGFYKFLEPGQNKKFSLGQDEDLAEGYLEIMLLTIASLVVNFSKSSMAFRDDFAYAFGLRLPPSDDDDDFKWIEDVKALILNGFWNPNSEVVKNVLLESRPASSTPGNGSTETMVLVELFCLGHRVSGHGSKIYKSTGTPACYCCPGHPRPQSKSSAPLNQTHEPEIFTRFSPAGFKEYTPGRGTIHLTLPSAVQDGDLILYHQHSSADLQQRTYLACHFSSKGFEISPVHDLWATQSPELPHIWTELCSLHIKITLADLLKASLLAVTSVEFLRCIVGKYVRPHSIRLSTQKKDDTHLSDEFYDTKALFKFLKDGRRTKLADFDEANHRRAFVRRWPG